MRSRAPNRVRYPEVVNSDASGRRRLARAAAVTPAVLLLTAAAPALAAAPVGWEPVPKVSVLHVLLILVFLPLALIAIITLLVYVPSLKRGHSYQPGRTWHAHPEWFGGPSDGVEAAYRVDPQVVQAAARGNGGANAHW
jgi:hypothetical protein